MNTHNHALSGWLSSNHCLLHLPVCRIAALSLLVTTVWPGMNAYADSQDYTWTTLPSIFVTSNGTQYTGVTSPGYWWKANIDIDAEVSGKVKSWKLWPVFTLTDQLALELDLEDYADQQTYPFGNRPKTVNKEVGRLVPDVAVREYAIGACETKAHMLRNQGQTDATIFATDHTIVVEVYGKFEVDISGISGNDPQQAVSDVPTTEIICMKTDHTPAASTADGFQSDGGYQDLQLSDATLTITPSTHSGACPVDLNLQLQVQGNIKGEFEYWLEHTDSKGNDWKSETALGETDQLTPANAFKAEFTETLSIPLPSAPTAGSVGLTQPPATGQYGFNPGGSDSSGGAVLKPGEDLAATNTVNQPNHHIGYFALVAKVGGQQVSLPDADNPTVQDTVNVYSSFVKSDWVKYDVTCDIQKSAAVGELPDNMQMQPKPGAAAEGETAVLGGLSTRPAENAGGRVVQPEDPKPVTGGGFVAAERGSETPALDPTIIGQEKPDITTHGIVLYGTGYTDGYGGWHQFLPGGPITPISTDKAFEKQNGKCLFHAQYHMINKGDVAAAGFNNRMTLNDQPLAHHTNLSLATGASEELMIKNIALTPGNHTFKLWLEDGNKVMESNENNNFRIAHMRLQGSCQEATMKTPDTPGPRTPDSRSLRTAPSEIDPDDTSSPTPGLKDRQAPAGRELRVR